MIDRLHVHLWATAILPFSLLMLILFIVFIITVTVRCMFFMSYVVLSCDAMSLYFTASSDVAFQFRSIGEVCNDK